MKDTRGFTLVEALVTAIILGIISVIAVTVFTMHNNQLRESSAMAKMQRQYENIIDQIALDVRWSNRVLGGSETFSQVPVSLPPANVNIIKIYDNNGTIIGEYSVAGNTFQESVGGVLQDFEAGGGAVEIYPANSSFSLVPYRTSVDITLRLKTTTGGNTYYLPSRKDGFSCRNAP
jgi:prepilin-type N-terminal cleavage/methylation domain-containing protein